MGYLKKKKLFDHSLGARAEICQIFSLVKFYSEIILPLATFFCHPPWGSIEFKRKIEISSHDKERRDWNLHLKHENHVKMERDFFISTLLSVSTPQLFLD